MVIQLDLRIEATMGQMTAPFDGPVISHLYDPRAGRTLRAVINAGLSLNENEQVLNEVFCFRGIPQDAARHVTDNSLVSLIKKAERFLVAVQKPCEQVFIRT